MKKVDNLFPFTYPSHCKDSHTSTRSTLKIAANLTEIHNFKANFHKVFELFSPKIMLTMVDTWAPAEIFVGGGQSQKGPP